MDKMDSLIFKKPFERPEVKAGTARKKLDLKNERILEIRCGKAEDLKKIRHQILKDSGLFPENILDWVRNWALKLHSKIDCK